MSTKSLSIVTIIQARTGSTRLPCKVLKEICGKPVLALMIERIRRSKLAGTIVVATTAAKDDDPIAELCRDMNVNYYRGSKNDLVERHYKAAREYDADAVVKIPSDCPLIDPVIIDNVIHHYIYDTDRFDYVSNLHPATYPDGNDVEIFSMSALYQTQIYSMKSYEREHTTPFIWDNPDIFRIGNIEWDKGIDLSNTYRFVLDYAEDLEFVRRVFEELYPQKPDFDLEDILNLLENKPEIHQLNSLLNGLNWYSKHLNEFRTNKSAC